MELIVSNYRQNASFILPGLTNQYIVIQSNSKFLITCSKIDFTYGTLFVSLNSGVRSLLSGCTSFAKINRSSIATTLDYCLSADFFIDLTNTQNELFYYQFDCGILENHSISAPSQFFSRICNIILIYLNLHFYF